MTTFNDPQSIIGRNAVDQSGAKIGKIGQVYLDDQSGQPAWVTVSTGLFGSKESFAPLYGARDSDGDLVLGVTKDQVKDAPNVDDDGHLSEQEQSSLYDYYSSYLGRGSQTGTQQTVTTGQTTGTTGNENVHGTQGYDTSGPTTDDAMTLSEEQVRVGTQQVQTGVARLRKFITTEQVSQTVPVSHQEAHLEREPITDANRGQAMAGPELSEEEHEVPLYAEQPVVSKETVPVERVRLDTETVTSQQQVGAEVRKEQAEVDTDSGTTRQ